MAADEKKDDTAAATTSAAADTTLKRLKELQLTNKDDKSGTSHAATATATASPPPVVSRIREEASAGGRPRPISVAVPNEAFVPQTVVAEIKAGEIKAAAETTANATANATGTSGAETPGRKRTNTITGLLKIRPRASIAVPNQQQQQPSSTDSPSATTTDVDGSPMPGSHGAGHDEESQSSIALGSGSATDQKPRSLRFTFNSNTTSTKPPDDITQAILAACQQHNLKTRLISRYLLECTAPPVNNLPGAEAVKIEIEVCKLPRLKNLHGLRFKRTTGTSADYKTVSEQILAAVQL